LLLKRLAAQLRKGEEIVNQQAHLLSVVAYALEVPLSLGSELRTVFLQQDAREPVHRTQWCAQIMGYGVAEGPAPRRH
jgi:hypothetical protein